MYYVPRLNKTLFIDRILVLDIYIVLQSGLYYYVIQALH